MKKVFIVSAGRTPLGSFTGGLELLSAIRLGIGCTGIYNGGGEASAIVIERA